MRATRCSRATGPRACSNRRCGNLSGGPHDATAPLDYRSRSYADGTRGALALAACAPLVDDLRDARRRRLAVVRARVFPDDRGRGTALSRADREYAGDGLRRPVVHGIEARVPSSASALCIDSGARHVLVSIRTYDYRVRNQRECVPLLSGCRTSVIVIAGCIAASRILLGMHYPSDVVAGAAIGSSLGYTAFICVVRYLP